MNALEKEIIDEFKELSKKYNLNDCFEDFLVMAAIAIRNTFDHIDFQKREDMFF